MNYQCIGFWKQRMEQGTVHIGRSPQRTTNKGETNDKMPILSN